MNRGDVVYVAARGPYTGKPRPAVIVQSDAFNPTHASITVCLLTSQRREAPLFRVPIAAMHSNGLEVDSDIMVDKIVTVRRAQLSEVKGAVGPAVLERVDQALRTWLGLAP